MTAFLLAVLFQVVPQEVKINEPVKVTLETEAPIAIEKARENLAASGDFLLVKETVEEAEGKWRYQWQLEPLRSGVFPVSLYKITGEKGPPSFVKAPLVRVLPFEAPEESPQLQPIPLNPRLPPELSLENQEEVANIFKSQKARNRKILDAKAFPWMEFFFTLFMLCMGGGFLWYLDWLEKNKKLPTPEELAIKELEVIREQYEGDPKTFIARVTDTLREFIQIKYQIKAPYLTTGEFMEKSVSHPKLSGVPRRNLGLFLSVADEVKFSQKPPSKEDADTALKFADAFVRLD